jgi:dUTP pyrophosphatase
MFVALINLGREAYTVRHGDRVAQLVVAPVVRALVEVVEGLEETGRGAGGFGSTGR